MSDPALNEASFRRACGMFATGVAIVATVDATGTPHGLTVNSFTSVSLQPPLILFCIDYRAAVLPAFREASHYGISILRGDQKEISNRFATRADKRFDDIGWHLGETGAPLMEDAIATIECARHEVLEAGDHFVFLARAVATATAEGDPLLYYAGGYRELK